MKGYIKIKVPRYEQQGLVPDKFVQEMYDKFPYIYLSEDFTHYLSKWLNLVNVSGTIGGLIHRGFRTHYIIDRDKVVTKLKNTRLAKKMLKNNIIKETDDWIWIINEELRLG